MASSLKSLVLSGVSVSSRFPTFLVFRYNVVITENNVLTAVLLHRLTPVFSEVCLIFTTSVYRYTSNLLFSKRNDFGILLMSS